MITQDEKVVRLRPARFLCSECELESQGHLMLRTRRSSSFGIPLCKDFQYFAKCDVCDSERPTLLTDSVFDASLPIPINDPSGLERSSFPKLMLMLFSVMWCIPIIGLAIYWNLFNYGSQIRGGWLRAYGWFVWLTLVFHLCWACVMVYVAATGRL